MTSSLDTPAARPSRRIRLVALFATACATVTVALAGAPVANADTVYLAPSTTSYTNSTAHAVTVCINGVCVVVLPDGVHGWD